MIILLLFAFIGGIITILSPCILPVLPIVLSGTVTGGKKRPLGIVAGFILSFTFFTLFLSSLVKATNISAETLRYIAIIVLIFFGASLLIPKFQAMMEKLFSKLSTIMASKSHRKYSGDFISGIPVGASLGLIWTPCVGPILAAIITLAATSTINSAAFFITLAYALGTAIPLLAITYGGRQLLMKIPFLYANLTNIQKGFGVLMILTGIGIYFNIDRQIQTIILTTFPNYGTGLTAIEDNPLVRNALENFSEQKTREVDDIFENPKSQQSIINRRVSLPIISKAPGFTGQSGEWINSPELTLEELKGKVVLVDFWTYTCINCIRTLPYLRNWHNTYKDQGFTIIGVHTPEFEFEKTLSNVQKAVNDFQLTYPIVQDNEFGIWKDYRNSYWPAKYLIDKDGFIRYTHFGEGNYDETEHAIQELLREAGSTVSATINNPLYDVSQKRSPETYLGYQRLEYLSSPEKVIAGSTMTFSKPKQIPLHHFVYEGEWTIDKEFAQPSTGSKLYHHFRSKDVFLVMRPKDTSISGKVKVFLNGELISPDSSGSDVHQGIITVNEDKLYNILRFPSSQEGELLLEFLDNTIELFAFTFG